MEREYVESRMMTSIGYDRDSATLEIEFKNNSQVWQYYGVAEQVYFELKYSDSKGRFFHDNIKGHYQENRVQ